MSDHRFGSSKPLSLGVEEEVLLVDDRYRLVAASERVLARVPKEAADRVSSEVFSEQIELKTGVCETAEQARDELEGLRSVVVGTGVLLIGAGLHPDAERGRPARRPRPLRRRPQGLRQPADDAGLRPPRPRRRPRPGDGDRARERVSALPAGTAGPQCQLAVPRGSRFRRCQRPGRGRPRLSALPDAAPLSRLRPLPRGRRPAGRRRRGRRLHLHLVGRAASPEAGNGRGPRARRPGDSPWLGRLRRPDPGDRRP